MDDEYHAIFECEAFEALRDSTGARDVISAAAGSVRAFMFSDHRGIVMKYISGLMDLVDFGDEGAPVVVGPQADQSAPG